MNFKSSTLRKGARFVIAAAASAGVYWAAYAAFVLDDQPIASISALEFNNYSLSGGGSVAYRGDYIRATWDGDLVAYNVATSGLISAKWRARTQLNSVAWDTGRKIFTSNGSGSGVPFQWSGTPALSTAQKAALGDATAGPQVLAYLRGDASNERTTANPGGSYRERYSKIGAVVHSRPYYYNHGVDSSGDAIERVYVGANDGMLHAFDADTGNELFAYVPSMLFGKLKDLSTPASTSFKYYVDGMLAIGSVPVTGGNVTLLAGGLGSGAKGVFALDVTSPTPATESAAATMAKYEITDATSGFANLGHVHSSPQIVKLNTGATALLVPNGVNSTSGVSSLFVINAATGAKLAEISAGTGTNNGLGGIAAIDKNGDGKVDAVYAGDLKGTLWKFDLSSATALPTAATAVFTPATGTARPITAAPSVINHPRGGVQVNFGTGQVYETADLSSTTNEYIYGIWDSANATGTTLVQPTLTEQSVTFGDKTTKVRTSSSSTVNYVSGGNKGWRITLSGGERLLGSDTFTDNGRYVITTSIPNAGSTQGAWLMQLNALTGGKPSVPFFDLNGDGVVSKTGSSDMVAVTSGGTTSQVPPSAKFLGSGVWSQPVLAQLNTTLDLPYFNYNSNSLLQETTTTTTTTPPSTDRGVSGGHFDFDIYYNVCDPLSTSGYNKTCTSNTHNHEYDDVYDVVGVNMLNASNTAFNLLNAISSTSTAFKIMVTNTNWSPAASLKVVRANSDGTTLSLDARVWNLPLSPDGFLAATAGGAALTFTRANLLTFTYYLPLDAFANKEWKSGSGDVRAGLIPTVTGCVRGNTGAQGASSTGAWMNGALTFQLVKSTTPATAVEATVPSAAGGYRLKKDTTSQANQLAQYTSFWHHPNGKCIADSGWTKAPPPDTVSDATAKTPAAGSGDPKGTFTSSTSGSLGSIAGGTTTTVTDSNGVEVLVSFERGADGSWTKIVCTKSNPTDCTRTASTPGTAETAGVNEGVRAKLGRLGWQELVR
jgi:hypothetical protein